MNLNYEDLNNSSVFDLIKYVDLISELEKEVKNG